MIAPFEDYDSRQCFEEGYRQNVYSSRLLIGRASYLRGGFCFRLPAPGRRRNRTSAKGLSYRTLGKTGLKVTSVGFGCMVTSDASVIDARGGHGHQLLRYLPQLPARKQRAAGGHRPQRQAAEHCVFPARPMAATKQAALQELDTSLSELGTDHLDIWYLHVKDSPE